MAAAQPCRFRAPHTSSVGPAGLPGSAAAPCPAGRTDPIPAGSSMLCALSLQVLDPELEVADLAFPPSTVSASSLKMQVGAVGRGEVQEQRAPAGTALRGHGAGWHGAGWHGAGGHRAGCPMLSTAASAGGGSARCPQPQDVLRPGASSTARGGSARAVRRCPARSGTWGPRAASSFLCVRCQGHREGQSTGDPSASPFSLEPLGFLPRSAEAEPDTWLGSWVETCAPLAGCSSPL